MIAPIYFLRYYDIIQSIFNDNTVHLAYCIFNVCLLVTLLTDIYLLFLSR